MNRINKFFEILVGILCWAGIIIAIYNTVTFKDSIRNPQNEEYVIEVAFDLGIDPSEVTQRQFNQRYKD